MDLPFKPEFIRQPEGASKDARTPILPLLAGYWSFGQYWGVWVILVFEFQKAHHISNPGLGLLYTLLSGTAIVVMLLIAPRMQPFSLSTNVPLSLTALGIGTVAITYLPSAFTFLGFAAVRCYKKLHIHCVGVANRNACLKPAELDPPHPPERIRTRVK